MSVSHNQTHCLLCNKELDNVGRCSTKIRHPIYNHSVPHYEWDKKLELIIIDKYKILFLDKSCIIQFRKNGMINEYALGNIELDLAALNRLSIHELDQKMQLYISMS